MNTESGSPAEPCTKCDEIKLQAQLGAEEAARAFQRELQKVGGQHENELAKLARQQDNDLAKLARQHELELAKAEDAAVTDFQKARWQTDAELTKAFHQTIADVAKGSIDRSRDSAKFVQTAAAAIVTLYSGLLALVFSVTDNPLPLRGVYAAVFLGLAVALATAYLAFITKPPSPKIYAGGGNLTEMQLHRTGYLTRWVNATVHDRRWAIRASVISLALGVAFIPAAFIATSRPVAIPDPPVTPNIPSTIAAPVTDQAVQLFEAQVQGYEAAALARNEAIERAAVAASDIADDETDLNIIVSLLALGGLLVVLFGPWVYSKSAREATG